MKHFILFFLVFIPTSLLFSQTDRESASENNVPMMKLVRGNRIFGKVLDIQTGKPIEAASVQLLARVKNPMTNKNVDSLVGAMLTKSNGDFNFENVASFDSLHLKISAIGYSESNRVVQFAKPTGTSYIHKDIGNIIMARDAEKLEGITIVAERPALVMGIDKKIFDVGNSLTSKGGTAVDVLKNIPAVSVDVDGNVELRNSSPKIFIDGRPTILTLEQIASENIDRVELITNPSAKYDASSGSGIINIILKKNKGNGLNGLISVTGGLPEVFRSDINLNLRQGKFNFFLSGGYSHSANDSKGSSFRRNKMNGIVQNYFEQNSLNSRESNFKSLKFGIDYFLDNRNTITLSQGLRSGIFKNHEKQSQQYLNQDKFMERYGDRVSDSRYRFNRSNSELLYTHKFPKKDKELNVSVNVNYGDAKDQANILNKFFLPDGSEYENPNKVRNEGANETNSVTAKIDFENPLGENKKLETGLRSYIKNYKSYFNSFSLQNGSETKLPLSNNYKYQEQVHAAYITYTGMLNSIGYQIGLRGEYSKFDGELIDSAQSFGYEYPSKIENIWDALFPSLFLSKKLNKDEEIQLNYSRRVRRPRFWQLNPFIDINDPLNIQQGNPALKPEFRNSMEFNYSKSFKNNSNFLGVIYYTNTQGDITRYSDTLTTEQYEQFNNAAVDPNAILNTYINSASTNRVGLELTLQQKISRKFDITPSANFAYRKVKANVDDLNLTNEGFNWGAEITANYKFRPANESSFFNKLSLQLNAEYESTEVLPQGKRLADFDTDFAISKDFLNENRGSLTFSINDVFNTQRRGTIYDTEYFYQESYRRRRVRSFRLTFSYKFGDADFSLFKRMGNGGFEEGGRG